MDSNLRMNAELGRLHRVELRDVWQNEAGDFTPWLANEENIRLLGETIGLDLEVEATEKDVGPFRADILCKETASSNRVLIENQLERTDHNHLGQLITYASGLQTVTIVWIAQRFTDEHRSALDWLNEITDTQFNFFGLEIELWRIGESNVAPKFNIVCQPNDWTRSVREKGTDERGKLWLEYWRSFRQFLEQAKSSVRPAPSHQGSWLDVPMGRTGFFLYGGFSYRHKKFIAGLAVVGRDSASFYDLLYEERNEIERDLDMILNWDRDTYKTKYISVSKDGFDPESKSQWESQHEWLKNCFEGYDRAFRGRIRSLDISPFEEAEMPE